MRYLYLLLAAAFTFAVATPGRANIVVNPGFESGLSPWVSVQGVSANDPWSVQSFGAHTGTKVILTGCSNAACADSTVGAYFYQDLTTVTGAVYDLDFWAKFGGSPDEMRVYWDGTLIADLLNQPSSSSFSQFTVNGLTATSTTTRLLFTGYQGPGIMYVDDVSVTAEVTAQPTPEPATLAILALGLAGLGVVRRRRAG